MGLQLSQTTDQNATGNYWRVDTITWNKFNQCRVTMSLYTDAATAHSTSGRPLTGQTMFFPMGTPSALPLLYPIIKTPKPDPTTGAETNPFAAATDVFEAGQP